MYVLEKYMKKIIYVTSAVLAGILLFVVLAGFTLERSSLNPSFHAQLFEKHDIYSGTQYVISSSMTGFLNNLKKTSPEVYEQQKDIFSLLEKNLTADLIAKNLDSLREGIFEYFRNDRKFLPDIYLSTQPDSEQQTSVSTGIQVMPSATGALSKISKVNLGAILMYTNRTDIVDYLSVIKLFYYILSVLPGLLLPCFLLLFLIGLGTFRKFTDVLRWGAIAAISCGLLEAILGTGLLVYAYLMLPDAIYPITMTLSMENQPVLAYLRECLHPLYFFLILTGGIFLLLASAALVAPRFFPLTAFREVITSEVQSQKVYKYIRNSLYIFCILILSVAIGYQGVDIKKDFIANDFWAVITKMKGVATVTQVISAKDDAIYDVQLKVLDEKSSKPVANAEINIIGKSFSRKKDFNETKTTNEKGELKFTLDKGNYRLTFNQATFPAQYTIPSPYFFELRAPGTKVISINLEPVPETKPKWGFAEIEVLDASNTPVPNLELAVLGIPFAPGYPDKVYSYTNSEGIAVFKLNEGTYKVNFTEGKLPQKYLLPSNLEVSINSSTLSRYTLRLVEKTAAKPTPTP